MDAPRSQRRSCEVTRRAGKGSKRVVRDVTAFRAHLKLSCLLRSVLRWAAHAQHPDQIPGGQEGHEEGQYHLHLY